jgi:hypothetical protein
MQFVMSEEQLGILLFCGLTGLPFFIGLAWGARGMRAYMLHGWAGLVPGWVRRMGTWAYNQVLARFGR